MVGIHVDTSARNSAVKSLRGIIYDARVHTNRILKKWGPLFLTILSDGSSVSRSTFTGKYLIGVAWKMLRKYFPKLIVSTKQNFISYFIAIDVCRSRSSPNYLLEFPKKCPKLPSKLVTKNDFPKNHHLSISLAFSKSFTFIFWHIFNFAYAACVRSKALTQVEMTLQASASGLSDEDGQKLSTLRTRLVTGNVEKPMRICQGPPFTPSYYRRSFGQNWIERVLDPGSVWN